MGRKAVGEKKRMPAYLLLLSAMSFPSSAFQPAMASSAVQQQSVVTGTVVDEKGETVIGATIKVLGQNNVGAVTDLDGNFRLTGVPDGTKIEVSYIGYKTKTLTVKSGVPIKIALEENAQNLQGVEVVAYGTQKKVTVTGAISSIKGDELVKAPTSSVANVLAGAVSGLSSIQNSGMPGADDATLYIRGKATFAKDGATPLVQIDGVTREMEDFTQMDPNDIESISVLKDASATAVFGVQGANGVILITTKRGKEGKAKISFSSVNSVIMPTKTVELANAYQYAQYYNQMRANDGQTPMFSESVIEKFKTGSDPIRFPDTDWIDYTMKKATFQTQNNVNISGGTKKVRYYISAGMMSQGGLYKEFNQSYHNDFRYTRFNYRANLDMDVTNTTKLTFSLSGKVDDSQRPNTGSQNINKVFQSMYNSTPFSSPGIVNGKFIVTANNYTDLTSSEQLPFTGTNGLTSYWGTGAKNISSNTLIVDLALNQKLDFITKGLNFKIKGAYNSWFTATKTVSATYPTYTAKYLKEDGTVALKKSGETGPLTYAEDSPSPGRNWYFEASLNWQRDFGLNHLSALALYNQRKEYYPSSYSYIPRGLVGLVGRITYDWNTRYLAEFNVGYNGSENFPENKRFGFFPAGSIGWIASEEKFWEPIKHVVNYFKLRATWGLVGNDKTGADRFIYTPDPFSVNGSSYNFGGNASSTNYTAGETTIHNQNVSWETAFKQNYGADINFFGDRLRTTFDYYYEKRRDILLTSGLYPTILGFDIPVSNGGAVDSWGYEITARWQDKIGSDFNYWISGNLSYNQNKIIERQEAPTSVPYQLTEGHRIGSRSLYKFYGFYYKGIEEQYKKDTGYDFPTHSGVDPAKGIQPGDAVYVDLNHDGIIDSKDTAVGLDGTYTDDPQYTAGLGLGFSYKGWDFSMQFTGAWNVSRLLEGIFVKPFTNSDNNWQGGLLIYQYESTWSENNPNALYPRASQTAASNNYAASTLYEKNSSYLRLKSFQLAYNFNFPWMKRIKLNTLQLSLSGYNVFTITSFKWGDPESSTSSLPTYPLTRSFALGLKVGF